MELFDEFLCGTLKKYCANENCIKEELPEIRIVESIWDEIEKARPDMADKLNKDEIDKRSGYTLPLDNETLSVLIDKTYFFDSISKNFFWVEVLIHEITHCRDYKNNLGIFGHDTYDSMMTCRSFWYWTEFHARYKGTLYMLDYVNCLPDVERRKYETNMIKTFDNELAFIISDTNKETRCYRFMHLLGDIAAYNEKGFSIRKKEVEAAFPDYWSFIEFLKTKDQVVDVDYLTILGREIRQYIN